MTSITYTPSLAPAFDGQTLRMKIAAEKLLQEFEAAEVPKDYAGIARAARALMSLNRLIRSLYEEKKATRKTAKAHSVAEPVLEPEIEIDLETAEDEASEPAKTPMVLNRHERRRIAAQLLKEEKQRRAA